jgi:hypothetical protein
VSAELFSTDWATSLERELGASPSFRSAAGRLAAGFLLILEPDPAHGLREERALFLDLAHGSCRAARPALPNDRKAASYWLSAPAGVWHRILDGELEPAGALTSGKLRLARGSLFFLLPHLGAANELLMCARRVPTAPFGENGA